MRIITNNHKNIKIGDRIKIPDKLNDGVCLTETVVVIGLHTNFFVAKHKNGCRECVLYNSEYRKV